MASDPFIGRTLGGTFVVERTLGQGGMGAVYVARHVRTGKTYAVKVLRPDHGARSDEAATRFQREAAALAELNHPGIVAIQDFAQTDDGVDYLVMDLLEGEDLSERMARTGRLPLDEAVRVFRETAVALMVAHDTGIIHRDLKPGNVFLRSARGAPDRAMILDFGLARMAEGVDTQHLTASGVAMGTPLYMAPEQAAGERVGKAADQYALAVMLYEMISGEPPFTAPSAPALLVKVLTTTAPTLGELGAAPPHVSAAVARAMSKAPQERFTSISNFLAAVEGVAAVGITRAPAAQGIAATRAMPATGAPAYAGASPATRPTLRLERSLPLVAIAATVIALLVVGGAFLWRAGRSVSLTVADVRTPEVDGGVGRPSQVRQVTYTSTWNGVGAAPTDAGTADTGPADAGTATAPKDAGPDDAATSPAAASIRARPRRRRGARPAPERGAHPANTPRLGPPPAAPDREGRAELEAVARSAEQAANAVHGMLSAVERVERDLRAMRAGRAPRFCAVGGLADIPNTRDVSAVVQARASLLREARRACEAVDTDDATRTIAARHFQGQLDTIVSRLNSAERRLRREVTSARRTGY